MRPLDPITAASFAIVDAELAAQGANLPPDQHPLVRRVIHSTADFAYAGLLRFHPAAIDRGVAALLGGAPVVADVQMVAAGVDRARLAALGSRLICEVGAPAVRAEAAATGSTRSAAGIRQALRAAGAGAVVAVGNAPTALREVLRLAADPALRPALIIGVPVGFVDAVESKDALRESAAAPWIASLGRKGGSPVAVALVNALLHLALPPSREG